MFWSLHRDEFYRHGNIAVTSLGKEISLWQITGLKIEALMISLYGAELVKLAEKGIRPC